MYDLEEQRRNYENNVFIPGIQAGLDDYKSRGCGPLRFFQSDNSQMAVARIEMMLEEVQASTKQEETFEIYYLN